MNPPETFWLAIDQFNQRDFYACHDTLEAIWLEADPDDKAFYQGILQIAVGLYHLSHLNWRGAAILLGEGLNRLAKYEPDEGGIAIDALSESAAVILQAVQRAGPEGVEAIAVGLGLRSSQDSGQDSAQSVAIVLPHIDRLEG